MMPVSVLINDVKKKNLALVTDVRNYNILNNNNNKLILYTNKIEFFIYMTGFQRRTKGYDRVTK